MGSMAEIAKALDAEAEKARSATLDGNLGAARTEANQRYQALVSQLSGQGITDPSQYGRLVQDRHRLENELQLLDELGGRIQALEHDAQGALAEAPRAAGAAQRRAQVVSGED